MIKIERTPRPAILERKGAEWARKLLGATTAKGKNSAESKYRHKAVKEALLKMFNGKCAYCESKITHIDYPHIEHYKPKSLPAYRALAFEWTNLLLACGVCNGAEHKGDRFPEAAEGGPIINPCDEEPDEHFDFIYDRSSRLATVIGKTTRGETTEKLLGLNRHELRAYRSTQVQKLFALKLMAQTEPEAEEVLKQAQQDYAEYAAFARILSRREIISQEETIPNA